MSFAWSAELQHAFESARDAIVQSVKDRVKTFSPNAVTCLSTDWSNIGLGAVLWQKHCSCAGVSLTCCNGGWLICGVRSRYCNQAESNYAPIEGEALGVYWGLDKFKHYTLGCPNLYVAVNHRPLVGIFNTKSICDIDNPRILKTREKLLRWNFHTFHLPGVLNKSADAASRFPVGDPMELDHSGFWEGAPWPGGAGEGAPGFIGMLQASPCLMSQRESAADMLADGLDEELIQMGQANLIGSDGLEVVKWETVKLTQHFVEEVVKVKEVLASGRTDAAAWSECHPEFYRVRGELTVVDGVLLKGERVYIPPNLRPNVMGALHRAHQGSTGMSSRASASVWWPGITNDIQSQCASCGDCDVHAPSQPAAPPLPKDHPQYPMEQMCADYFHFQGREYVVFVDRYSNWPSVVFPKNSGANELVRIMRDFFSTMGVPRSLATDGGPSFMSQEVGEFLERWGVQHRVSSAYHPHSNLRAETAVKTVKRLLMGNVGPSGSLNTDKFMAALLQYRNTPDCDLKLSPAQILFGRELRDAVPIHQGRLVPRAEWILTADAREKAMARRHIMRSEVLSEHTKTLPVLRVGDVVLVQNQTGPKSNKWEQSGVVVELNGYDQYQIKMDGSGRVSLRNRQFLKKIVPVGSMVDKVTMEDGTEAQSGPHCSDHLKVKGTTNVPAECGSQQSLSFEFVEG